MKKILKSKIIMGMIGVIMASLLLTVPSYAAGSIAISSSTREIEEGKTFTITVTVNDAAGKVALTSSGNVSLNKTTEFIDNGSVQITATAKSAGKATITVIAEDVTGYDSNPVQGQKSVSVTVKAKESGNTGNNGNSGGNNNTGSTGSNNQPGSGGENKDPDIPKESTPITTTKSSNNYLSSLKINEGTLNPKFNYRTQRYTVEAKQDLEKIKITAKAEHAKATVSGTGTKNLNPGENTFEVNVTAEDGKVRTYTIVVNKPEKIEEIETSDLKLESLKIQGIDAERNFSEVTISPEFTPDIRQYSCLVGEEIESLQIDAMATKENFIVEVTGNENLVEGENIVTISIKTEDGQKESKYVLFVKKEAKTAQVVANVEEGEMQTQENPPLWDYHQRIWITILTSTITMMGIAFAIIEYRYGKKKKEEEDDDESFYGFHQEEVTKEENKEEIEEIKPRNTKKGKHF